MKNVYHREIMEHLLPSGRDGMRVCQLVRRIYNLHTNLFANDLSYPDLYKNISRYLWSQSKQRKSPFKHVCRGYYCIKSDVAVQLDLFIDLEAYEQPQRCHQEPKHEPKVRQLVFDFAQT